MMEKSPFTDESQYCQPAKLSPGQKEVFDHLLKAREAAAAINDDTLCFHIDVGFMMLANQTSTTPIPDGGRGLKN